MDTPTNCALCWHRIGWMLVKVALTSEAWSKEMCLLHLCGKLFGCIAGDMIFRPSVLNLKRHYRVGLSRIASALRHKLQVAIAKVTPPASRFPNTWGSNIEMRIKILIFLGDSQGGFLGSSCDYLWVRGAPVDGAVHNQADSSQY